MSKYDFIKNISIIYTWVDGSEISYRKLRDSYSSTKGITARDRCYNELKYSLLSIKKNMPWHKGKIFLVTPNTRPKWLPDEIILVPQKEIIPIKLQPTFNTNLIEFYLHKVPGITDYFIHMNDDYFINKLIQPTDFFSEEKDVLHMNMFSNKSIINMKSSGNIWGKSVRNTCKLLNKKCGNMNRYFLDHAPYIYHKLLYEKIHQMYAKEISQSITKFRSSTNLVPPYLLLYTNLQKNFLPHKMKYHQTHHHQLHKSVLRLNSNANVKSKIFLCLNDCSSNNNSKKNIIKYLEKRFIISQKYEILKKEIYLEKNTETVNCVNEIPKNIFQTFDKEQHLLPDEIKKIIQQWEKKYPNYNYQYYDDKKCIDFLEKYYSKRILNAFNALLPGAYKADLWRLCVLYHFGGFYFDIKFINTDHIHLDQIIEIAKKTQNMFLIKDKVGSGSGIYNAIMATFPKNKLFLEAINLLCCNIEKHHYGKSHLDVTGPQALKPIFYHYTNRYITHGRLYANILFKNKIIFKPFPNYKSLFRDNRNINYRKLWKKKNIYKIQDIEKIEIYAGGYIDAIVLQTNYITTHHPKKHGGTSKKQLILSTGEYITQVEQHVNNNIKYCGAYICLKTNLDRKIEHNCKTGNQKCIFNAPPNNAIVGFDFIKSRIKTIWLKDNKSGLTIKKKFK